MSCQAARKLDALSVKKTNKTGKYIDGLVLYLIVEQTLGTMPYDKGKLSDLGLGSTSITRSPRAAEA